MKNLIIILAAMFAALFLVVGCASPSARIEKNPALFKSFPAEAQTQIENGKIGVGFTREMVEMAWGRPSKKLSEQTAAGKKEIWIYSATETKTAYVDPYSNYRYGVPSIRRSSRQSIYGGLPHTIRMQQRVERARVIFAGDTVERILNQTP